MGISKHRQFKRIHLGFLLLFPLFYYKAFTYHTKPRYSGEYSHVLLSAEGQRKISKLQESSLQTLQEGCVDAALNRKALKQVLKASKTEEEGHRSGSACAGPSARAWCPLPRRPRPPRTHRRNRRSSAGPTPSSRSTSRAGRPLPSSAKSRGARASSTARCARNSASPTRMVTSERVPSASNLRERTVTAASPRGAAPRPPGAHLPRSCRSCSASASFSRCRSTAAGPGPFGAAPQRAMCRQGRGAGTDGRSLTDAAKGRPAVLTKQPGQRASPPAALSLRHRQPRDRGAGRTPRHRVPAERLRAAPLPRRGRAQQWPPPVRASGDPPCPALPRGPPGGAGKARPSPPPTLRQGAVPPSAGCRRGSALCRSQGEPRCRAVCPCRSVRKGE